MNDHNCGDKPCSIKMEAFQVKKECISSDDDEEDTMVLCGNAFLCEICNFTDNESHAVFKDRDDLVLHTFKNHTSACIGCFENFHTPEDLANHVMVDNHGLPCCRNCWRLFPDQCQRNHHFCQTTPVTEGEPGDEGDKDGEDEEVSLPMEPQSEDEEVSLPMEPQSEDEEVSLPKEPQSEDEESEFAYSSGDDSSVDGESDHRSEEGDRYLSCIHCTAEGFKSQQDLQIHTHKAHPSVCVVCFEGFDDETNLQKHQKALNHTVWSCAKCDEVFMIQDFYLRHVTINHMEDCPYHCLDCDKKGVKKKKMLAHTQKLYGDLTTFTGRFKAMKIKMNWRVTINTCNICFKSFYNSYSLMIHTFREHNEPGQTHVYKCELCQLGFGRAKAFEFHLKLDHADDADYLNEAKTLVESAFAKPLNCESCGEVSSCNNALQRHITSKHPELRPYKCSFCGLQYSEESDFLVHVWAKHQGANPFSCPMCDFMLDVRQLMKLKFSGKGADMMEKHLRERHGYQGMVPYIYCFVHKKAFKTKFSYLRHFHIYHINPADYWIPRYPCHICGKKLDLYDGVTNRINRPLSSSTGRLKCDDCEKSFKNKGCLTLHENNHCNLLQCKICNRTFMSKIDLLRHIFAHSGKKPSQCKLCGFKVKKRESLIKHVKRCHLTEKKSKSAKSLTAMQWHTYVTGIKTEIANGGEENVEMKPVTKKHKFDSYRSQSMTSTYNEREEIDDKGATVRTEPQSDDEGSDSSHSSEDDSSVEGESEHQAEEGDISCIHCNAEDFKSQYDLRMHTFKAHPSVCVVCFEGFDDETSLQEHQKALNHTVWKCVKCDKFYIRRTFYRIHLTVSHPEECRYECSDCDWKGFSKAQLVDHRSLMHPVSRKRVKLNWQIFKNKCNICLKTYMTGYSLLLHMFREHNKPGQTHVYKCELCQLGFGLARAFENHLKQIHADDFDYLSKAKTLVEANLAKSLTCEGCGDRVSYYRTLQRHIRTKHPELRPHKCNICGTGYTEESDVRVHVWCDHEGPPGIVCPACDFSCRSPRLLEKHLKRRHGYKGMPYMYCFVHKKKFPRFRDYHKHFEAVHVDPADRPARPPLPKTGFPCHLCSKEFGSTHRRKQHILRVHHSREKVKCDVCGKLFKDFTSLSGHKRKHTDDFKCKICNKTFEMQCHLDRHQVVHSGEKPFQCELCGLRMSQKSALQRHVKVVHVNGKPLKSLRARKTRGPKHEGGMNKKENIDEEQDNNSENRSAEFQKETAGDAEDDAGNKRLPRGRKRRKDSSSPPGKGMLPKRRRGRPRKDKTKVVVQLKSDVKVNTRRRRRPRMAKDKAEKQLHQQITSDDDSIGPDDEELLSDAVGTTDEWSDD